jgi:hypothetical protein
MFLRMEAAMVDIASKAGQEALGSFVRMEAAMVDIASKEGQEALGSQRYYSLSYDIPTTLNDLAELIRSRIRRYALSVHESGYLVPAANVDAIRDTVKVATTAINDKRLAAGKPHIASPKIRLLKIDADQLPDILDWAQERSVEIAKEITASFEARLMGVTALVEKAIEAKTVDMSDKSTEIATRKKAILRDLKKRAEDADAAFFWFATAGGAKSLLKAVLGLIEAEKLALAEVSQIGETPLKQTVMPTT